MTTTSAVVVSESKAAAEAAVLAAAALAEAEAEAAKAAAAEAEAFEAMLAESFEAAAAGKPSKSGKSGGGREIKLAGFFPWLSLRLAKPGDMILITEKVIRDTAPKMLDTGDWKKRRTAIRDEILNSDKKPAGMLLAAPSNQSDKVSAVAGSGFILIRVPSETQAGTRETGNSKRGQEYFDKVSAAVTAKALAAKALAAAAEADKPKAAAALAAAEAAVVAAKAFVSAEAEAAKS